MREAARDSPASSSAGPVLHDGVCTVEKVQDRKCVSWKQVEELGESQVTGKMWSTHSNSVGKRLTLPLRTISLPHGAVVSVVWRHNEKKDAWGTKAAMHLTCWLVPRVSRVAEFSNRSHPPTPRHLSQRLSFKLHKLACSRSGFPVVANHFDRSGTSGDMVPKAARPPRRFGPSDTFADGVHWKSARRRSRLKVGRRCH